mgnify:CR=1 FL=1
MAFAHSVRDRPLEEWHRLEDHLRNTGAAAADFAAAWNAGDWARLAGLWHDLGKYSNAFQARIGAGDPDAHVESQGRPDHSTAGAIFSSQILGRTGLPVALAIAGHHAGLGNLQEEVVPRLKRRELLENAIKGGATGEWLLPRTTPTLPMDARDTSPENLRALELWTRFLFSALVDADFLDTERFLDRTKADARAGNADLTGLLALLETHTEGLGADRADAPVNQARRRILNACRDAATREPGVFSLTAPTGAGKTLASMTFALRHAVEHGLRRVIVVLPFTSIIEQSAQVYRDILGQAAVVEHHSNLDPERETLHSRLCSENWDAPIIVTTGVQFFESLFANRSSACRKLHNIARSVVILDEAQTLPTALLTSILDVLRQLTTRFGSTLVVSTATQPALAEREGFPGLVRMREILPDPASEFAALRRARIEWPRDASLPVAWADLAAELRSEESFLAIVHKRADALELISLLPDDVLHLSASMCPAHRLELIHRIKEGLRLGRPVRVVSTQLVEAGVDIDFPVVYRALAGLDAIAQAAGRCNREGRREVGRVVVFVAPTDPPPGILRKGLETTRGLLAELGENLDPLSPEHFEGYFRRLYFLSDTDRHGIQGAREKLRYREVAEKAVVIDQTVVPVVVPWGKAAAGSETVLDRLRKEGPNRRTMRALQPFTATVSRTGFRRLFEVGALEHVREVVWALAETHRNLYDVRLGLRLTGPLFPDPESLSI